MQRVLFVALVVGTLVAPLALHGLVAEAHSGSDGMQDSVAFFDPNTGEWHLLGSDGRLSSFYYGVPGDLPLMGDWNCDGEDTVGMFRPANGFVYLRNSNTFGVADLEFFYGMGGDLPIAGDWDHDDCDTLSIYRPSQGRVFVANRLGTVPADYSFYFGVPGDRPFPGDFDGDGTTTVGLYRESTGFVYFRNTLTTGIAELEFFYGEPSDRIMAGDWDQDGDQTVGIFRPASGLLLLQNANRTGLAEIAIQIGESHWIPLAGRFSTEGLPTPTSTTSTTMSSTTSSTSTSSSTTTSSTTTSSTTTSSTTSTTMPAPADLLVVAYTDRDGLKGYAERVDDMIAQVEDTNRDGAVSVGDVVRKGSYPLSVDPGTDMEPWPAVFTIEEVISARPTSVWVDTSQGQVKFSVNFWGRTYLDTGLESEEYSEPLTPQLNRHAIRDHWCRNPESDYIIINGQQISDQLCGGDNAFLDIDVKFNGTPVFSLPFETVTVSPGDGPSTSIPIICTDHLDEDAITVTQSGPGWVTLTGSCPGDMFVHWGPVPIDTPPGTYVFTASVDDGVNPPVVDTAEFIVLEEPDLSKVVIFRDAGFDGQFEELDPGIYDINQLGVVGNDEISSIHIPPDYRVNTCSDQNRGGTCQIETVSVSDFGNHDNTLSWLEVVQVSDPNVVARINAGGPTLGDWMSDFGGTTVDHGSTVSNVPAGVSPAIFETERYGDKIFNVRVSDDPSVVYTVRIHTAERFEPNFAVGKRIFTIWINGNGAFHNVDIYEAVGENTAYTLEASGPADFGNSIVIGFESIVENAVVMGIEVMRD